MTRSRNARELDELWCVAARVYDDDEDSRDGRAREADWLNRAEIAYGADNFVHLPRAVLICSELGLPPPKWLTQALMEEFPRLLGGERSTVRKGRHADMLRQIADAVVAVESLLRKVTIRLHDEHVKNVLHLSRRNTLRGGNDIYSRAAHEFEQEANSKHWVTFAHKPDAIKKQAEQALRKLQDPQFRAFVGANFPPALLHRISSKGKGK